MVTTSGIYICNPNNIKKLKKNNLKNKNNNQKSKKLFKMMKAINYDYILLIIN